MQLFQLDGEAIIDVVSVLPFIGQDRTRGASIPGLVQIGGHAFLIQAVGSLAKGQIRLYEPAIHLVPPGHFFVRPGHQDHGISLR